MVQARLNINTRNGFLQGSFKSDSAIILQDAGRTTPLLNMTVMGRIAASQKLVPLDPADAAGGAIFAGIYKGPDIAAADLVAGDVDILELVKGGDGIVDEGALVFENAATLDTVIDTTQTVRDFMEIRGIFAKAVVDVHEYEN